MQRSSAAAVQHDVVAALRRLQGQLLADARRRAGHDGPVSARAAHKEE